MKIVIGSDHGGVHLKEVLKQHLADMGFVPGGAVTVVSTIGGNVIVKVKESRVAISREMAQKIMI